MEPAAERPPMRRPRPRRCGRSRSPRRSRSPSGSPRVVPALRAATLVGEGPYVVADDAWRCPDPAPERSLLLPPAARGARGVRPW